MCENKLLRITSVPKKDEVSEVDITASSHVQVT